MANIGMGFFNPAFQRAILNNSGLAHWYTMNLEANFTAFGARRSQIA